MRSVPHGNQGRSPVNNVLSDGLGSGTFWQDVRRDVREILRKPHVEFGLALVVVASMLLLILETDQSAPASYGESGNRPSAAILVANKVFVALFVFELMLRIFVDGRAYFTTPGICNFLVTFLDLVLSFMELIRFDDSGLPAVSVLRCFRLVRLTRLIRVVQYCPELGYMLQGIASALWTVMWGVVFIMMILLVWSLLAVQVLHPINLDVVHMGTYADCSRCPHAFSTVWNSFLTFSQTLVFGDSWGAVALPIIQEKWWTIFIFYSAFATVGLAAMNLILAAIVDSGAQAREAALQSRTEKMRQTEAQERQKRAAYLYHLCQELDVDESGKLSKEELLEGYDQNREFREAANGMNFMREDIEVLFNIIDKDLSGDVDYTEFLDVMQHAQGEDTHQVIIFIKFAIMDMWLKRQEEEDVTRKKLDDLRQTLERKLCTPLSCPETCSTETTTSQAALPPTLKAKVPKRKAVEAGAPVEEDGAASPRPRRTSTPASSRRGSAPARQPKEPKDQEPKDQDDAEVVPKLVGDWRPLEAAMLLPPPADAADNVLQRGLSQELVRLLKKLTHETEAHTRILHDLDSAAAAGRAGRAPSPKPAAGAAEPRLQPGARPGPAEAVWPDSLALQVDSSPEPSPLPPSAHRLHVHCTRGVRVGL